MTRDELVSSIRLHEANCKKIPGTEFTVVEVMEFAPGILGVMDSDREFTIYFDATLYCSDMDISGDLLSFSANTGFVENVFAEDWGAILETAQQFICPHAGQIAWHSFPVSVPY